MSREKGEAGSGKGGNGKHLSVRQVDCRANRICSEPRAESSRKEGNRKGRTRGTGREKEIRPGTGNCLRLGEDDRSDRRVCDENAKLTPYFQHPTLESCLSIKQSMIILTNHRKDWDLSLNS